MLDPVALERAEKSIDEFINSRSQAKDKANADNDLWRLSEHQRQARSLKTAAYYRRRGARSASELYLSEKYSRVS